MSRLRRAVTLGLGLVVLVAIAGPATAARDVPLRPTGTLLRTPAAARTVTVPPGGCPSLVLTGTGDCGVVHAAGGDLLFTLEAGPVSQAGLVSRPWTVTIYRRAPSVPNGWQVALVTRASGSDPAALYANVTAKPADLTGDGHQSLVVGYRAEGTGEILDLDIVVGTPTGPRVAAHGQFYKGVIQIAAGRLVTYVPVYRTRDGNCCPSFTERDEIRNRNGRFVVATGPRFPTRTVDIPPGDLG
jgi:hypothetical protein